MNPITLHAFLAVVLFIGLTIAALALDWGRRRPVVNRLGVAAVAGAGSVLLHALVTALRFEGLGIGAPLVVSSLVGILPLGVLGALCLMRRIVRKPTAGLVATLVVTVLAVAFIAVAGLSAALGHMR